MTFPLQCRSPSSRNQRSPEPPVPAKPASAYKPRVLIEAPKFPANMAHLFSVNARANSLPGPSPDLGSRNIRSASAVMPPMTPVTPRASASASAPLAPPVGSAVKQDAKSAFFVVPSVPSTPQSGVRPRSNTWDASEKPVHEQLKQMYEISARHLPASVGKPAAQSSQISSRQGPLPGPVQSPAVGASQQGHVPQVPVTPEAAPCTPVRSSEAFVERPSQRPLLLSERHRKAAPLPQINSRGEIAGKRSADLTADEHGQSFKRPRMLSFDSPHLDRPYIA